MRLDYKISQYRVDYNNRPSHGISFMPVVDGTSGHLHCEIVIFLFLRDHRESDLFQGLQIQEFILRDQPFTTVARCSPHGSSLKLVTSSSRLQFCVSI